MPCPNCGGTSRKPIAPGYWECTTVIDDPAFPRSAWDDSDPWRAATHPKRHCRCSPTERRLKLRVNRDKSSVGSAFKATLLGFGFLKRKCEIKIRIDPKARKRAKDRLREITSRRWGVSMRRRIREANRFTAGWTAYFSLADTPRPFSDLDKWLRRRLRQVRWKEWRRYRTRKRNLLALGAPERSAREWAGSRKGYWRIGGSAPLQRALPKAYWRDLGLQGFTYPFRRLRDPTGTAGCGPTGPWVWEGRGTRPRPDPIRDLLKESKKA